VISSLPVDFFQEWEISPGRILGCKPYLYTMIPGKVDHIQGVSKHFFPGLSEFEPHMQFRGGNKDTHHVNIAVDCSQDISFACPGESADPGVKTKICNRLHALFLVHRHGREAGLDNFDTDLVQRGRYLYFLLAGERHTGSLFPVSECHVTDLNIQWFHACFPPDSYLQSQSFSADHSGPVPSPASSGHQPRILPDLPTTGREPDHRLVVS